LVFDGGQKQQRNLNRRKAKVTKGTRDWRSGILPLKDLGALTWAVALAERLVVVLADKWR